MTAGASNPPGDLERLIAAEAEIAARTTQALEQARALVASARARAADAEDRARDQLEKASADLAQQMAQNRERQLQAVADDLERQLARLQSIPDARITELARTMLDLLLQSGTSGRDP